jgi:hypothetical protein
VIRCVIALGVRAKEPLIEGTLAAATKEQARMKQCRTGVASSAHARRLAAAVAVGLFLSACGGGGASPHDGLPATPGASEASPAAGVNDPVVAAPPPAAAVAPQTPPPSAGVVTEPVPSPSPAFSWTKPAGFDSALADAISSQPSSAGGYRGQIDNPFPQLPGTTSFPGMQVTRPDAITLGDFFGRAAFRFSADAKSRHSNGLRAEFTGYDDFRFEDGDVFTYEFSTHFDEDYRNSAWNEWNLFAQFHGPGFGAWGLHTAGGNLHMKPPNVAENTYSVRMPARGEWHDFSWTIRWAHDSSGYATLEIDGEPVFHHRGATMHAGESYYYPKFGVYLGNNAYTQVIYSTPWVITPG